MTHVFKGHYFLKLGAIVTQILTWNQKGLAVFFFLVTSQLSDLEQCWLCLVLSGKNWTQHIISETLSIVHISLVRILFVLVKRGLFVCFNFEFPASNCLPVTHCLNNNHHTIWHGFYLIELCEEEKRVMYHNTLCLALCSKMLNFLVMSFGTVSLMCSIRAEAAYLWTCYIWDRGLFRMCVISAFEQLDFMYL